MIKANRNFIIISSVVVVIAVAAWIMLSNNNSQAQNTIDQNSPTPTITRHDNSGAGSQDSNPLQEHFNRAMQHLGL